MSELTPWGLHRGLSAAASDDPLQSPHARAFAAWIQFESIGQIPLLSALADQAQAATGPARQTAHTAVLGFAASLEGKYLDGFREALSWTMQRQYFVTSRPPTFEIDGLALLGVAVGILRLSGTDAQAAKAWLEGLLRQSLNASRSMDWNESLIAAAMALISAEPALDAIADDLRVALASKSLLASTEASRANAWALISGLTGEADGMTRAAAQLSALTWLLREASTIRLGSTSSADVAHLLNGVGRSMRLWVWDEAPRTPKSKAAQWDVENEYHVQDLLWVILAPVFPDLDDEEWLKSLGQHHPRADLAIPSLRLIVEVKFLRKGGKSVFSKCIEEVAADASTYLQDNSGYEQIVAFIWDDEARTEEHAELRKGLTRIRGVRDAIVLSRPSKMKRQLADDATSERD